MDCLVIDLYPTLNKLFPSIVRVYMLLDKLNASRERFVGSVRCLLESNFVEALGKLFWFIGVEVTLDIKCPVKLLQIDICAEFFP